MSDKIFVDRATIQLFIVEGIDPITITIWLKLQHLLYDAIGTNIPIERLPTMLELPSEQVGASLELLQALKLIQISRGRVFSSTLRSSVERTQEQRKIWRENYRKRAKSLSTLSGELSKSSQYQEQYQNQSNSLDTNKDPKKGSAEGKQRKAKRVPSGSIQVPEWIDPEAWDLWREHMKGMHRYISPPFARMLFEKYKGTNGHFARDIKFAISKGWGKIVPFEETDEGRKEAAKQDYSWLEEFENIKN